MDSTKGPQPVDARPQPLTDPADLFQLLGRMFASLVLFCLTVYWIFNFSLHPNAKNGVLTVTTGILSFIYQRATIKLWRRLREERAAAEAARDAAHPQEAAATV